MRRKPPAARKPQARVLLVHVTTFHVPRNSPNFNTFWFPYKISTSNGRSNNFNFIWIFCYYFLLNRILYLIPFLSCRHTSNRPIWFKLLTLDKIRLIKAWLLQWQANKLTMLCKVALTFKSVTVIRIKFLLVISMLIQSLRSWELRIWSPEVNFLDILITSLPQFYKLSMGTR